MKTCCKSVLNHPSLFTSVRWPKATTPRREQILSLIDHAVDWSSLEKIARPFYQADVRRTGRKGYSLAMMLRCFVLLHLWRMSDRQAESAILDSHAFAKFIGTDPWAPRPPSATSIRNFCALLQANKIDVVTSAAEGIVQQVKESLRAAGFEYRSGRIDDPVIRKATTQAIDLSSI